MGTFNTGIIQSTGDERSFLTLIYNHIMGLWDGITCSVKNGDSDIISPATPDDFVWIQNSVSYMEFTLDNISSIRFTSHPRDNADLRTREYTVAFIVNNATLVNKGGTEVTDGRGGLVFCGNSSWVGDGMSPTQSGTRKFIFSEYISDDVKILWIANKDGSTYKDSLFVAMMIKDVDGNWHYGGLNNGFNSELSSIYDSTGSVVATKSSLFTYAALAGYIDYITESGYVSAGTKIFSTPYIYDCSTVDFGSTVTLSDGNYMAVGVHSLVKL